MKNRITLSILAAAVLTSCQSSKPKPNPIQDQALVKPYETPRPVKEEYDKDWDQQFITPLRDNAIHKEAVNAIRKANAKDKNALAKFCLKPQIICFMQRIAYPNEKVALDPAYTKLIHRELYKFNQQEIAIFGYQK
ncbi:MAG: hypothetical protein H7328_01515 [Bdellovibrio sp.]|nr:hypothetical protein [Bdellovibrio sp.]